MIITHRFKIQIYQSIFVSWLTLQARRDILNSLKRETNSTDKNPKSQVGKFHSQQGDQIVNTFLVEYRHKVNIQVYILASRRENTAYP